MEDASKLAGNREVHYHMGMVNTSDLMKTEISQKPQKLLIVDDDDDLCLSLKWALSEEYQIFSASAGPKPLSCSNVKTPAWSPWTWGCLRTLKGSKKGSEP